MGPFPKSEGKYPPHGPSEVSACGNRLNREWLYYRVLSLFTLTKLLWKVYPLEDVKCVLHWPYQFCERTLSWINISEVHLGWNKTLKRLRGGHKKVYRLEKTATHNSMCNNSGPNLSYTNLRRSIFTFMHFSAWTYFRFLQNKNRMSDKPVCMLRDKIPPYIPLLSKTEN